jgi:hypothetical protein
MTTRINTISSTPVINDHAAEMMSLYGAGMEFAESGFSDCLSTPSIIVSV